MNKNNKNVIIGLVTLIIIGTIVASLIAMNRKSTGISAISEGATQMSNVISQVALGNTQNVLWNSQDITSNQVAINVIRKVSDNPASYELVRTVATSTANDGSATWAPSSKDLGGNLYVEIGCTKTASACRADISSSQLAVLDSSSYLNTANAYQAIEAAMNK
jgi:hypothetical protein